jgi:hypothetical protein
MFKKYTTCQDGNIILYDSSSGVHVHTYVKFEMVVLDLGFHCSAVGAFALLKSYAVL